LRSLLRKLDVEALLRSDDIFPKQLGAFIAWKKNFVDKVNLNIVEFDLDPAEVAELTGSADELDLAYREQVQALAAYRAATERQQIAQSDLKGRIRSLAGRLRHNPLVSEADQLGLGLRPRDRTRTRAAAPTSHPVVAVDTRHRLIHALRIRDSATSESVQKPSGVATCEVWMATGPQPPTDFDAFRFVGNSTKSKFLMEFPGESGGQTAHYIARWVNTRGERGPWGETASATIVG
jgi:hypothetical protein